MRLRRALERCRAGAAGPRGQLDEISLVTTSPKQPQSSRFELGAVLGRVRSAASLKSPLQQP